MIFKPKFFLDLGGADQQQPAVVAPVRQEAAAEATTPAAQPAAPSNPGPIQAGAAPFDQSGPGAAGAEAPLPTLTTAEAMVAELAAAQANRPAPSKATFAPECVTAGGATPMNRRSGGANLAGFKEMAKGMMRS
jgi:hypothetical protein